MLIKRLFKLEPILIVLHLAENGSLKEYLERNRQNPISTQDKINIARDVANGMLHLSSKRVFFFPVHNNFTFISFYINTHFSLPVHRV